MGIGREQGQLLAKYMPALIVSTLTAVFFSFDAIVDVVSVCFEGFTHLVGPKVKVDDAAAYTHSSVRHDISGGRTHSCLFSVPRLRQSPLRLATNASTGFHRKQAIPVVAFPQAGCFLDGAAAGHLRTQNGRTGFRLGAELVRSVGRGARQEARQRGESIPLPIVCLSSAFDLLIL